MDSSKYRDTMTDLVWEGKMPELTPEEQAAQAKASIGKPPPTSAIEEARALREQLGVRKKAAPKKATGTDPA